MRVTVLGSGTTSWDTGRAMSAYHVAHGDRTLLLDCGPGAMLRLRAAQLDYLTLGSVWCSHVQHVDHAGDLAALLFAMNFTSRHGERWSRTEPLTLFGPPGLESYVGHLEAAYPALTKRSYELILRTLSDDTVTWGGLSVEARRVAHGETPALGFRLSDGKNALTYSGDSGPCAALQTLCRDADLALVECTYADGLGPDIPGHLHARQVGALAADAGVRHLLLTHRSTRGDANDVTSQVRERYAGTLDFADDLQTWDVAPPSSAH